MTLDGLVETPSLYIEANGSAPNVTIPSTGQVDADYIQITADIMNVEGSITGYSGENGTGSFNLYTLSGTRALVNNNGSLQDFYSLSGNGQIDAQTIQVQVRGDLILGAEEVFRPLNEATPLGEIDLPPTLNGIQINPNGDLTDLELTGATIEVPEGYNNGTDASTSLSLTSTGGDITIGGLINVGIDNDSTGVITVNSAGNIDITNGPEFTADTVSLTAGQINTDEGGLSINSSNVTLNVNNVSGALSQDSDEPSNLFFTESTTGSSPEQIGSIQLSINGSTPSLSISANSLTLQDLNLTSFSTFTLSLTSANDINAGDNSATITGATSIALQVGVAATLAGDDSSNISYNSDQLTISDLALTSFAVTAPSITVSEGFPNMPNVNLNLTATTGDILSNRDPGHG